MKKDEVINACEKLYKEFSANGIDIIFDDRNNVQAGFKFSDADLIGVPLQIIVGERGLKENMVEVKIRETGERLNVKLDVLLTKVKDLLK